MRVIAGRLRGRKLLSFKATHIRPTTDRVKESIFNRIQSELPGAVVLDLFAGTGNLGIEALSRGAESVSFVDSHRKSIQILKENLQALDLMQESDVTTSDAFAFLKKPTKVFDLVFIDPPFTKKLSDDILEAIAASSACAVGGLIVIESSSQEKLKEKYSGLELLDLKSFGDKSLRIFKRQ